MLSTASSLCFHFHHYGTGEAPARDFGGCGDEHASPVLAPLSMLLAGLLPRQGAGAA
jgi:hypothetical protein